MNEKAIEKIQIRLLDVEEKLFKCNLDENLAESLNQDNLKINIGYTLISDKEAKTVVIEVVAKYILANKELLFFVASLTFEFPEFNEIFKLQEDRISEKITVIPTLINIAIGTLRGMIAVKTSGTFLKRFPLPLIDPNSLLKQANN